MVNIYHSKDLGDSFFIKEKLSFYGGSDEFSERNDALLSQLQVVLDFSNFFVRHLSAHFAVFAHFAFFEYIYWAFALDFVEKSFQFAERYDSVVGVILIEKCRLQCIHLLVVVRHVDHDLNNFFLEFSCRPECLESLDQIVR